MDNGILKDYQYLKKVRIKLFDDVEFICKTYDFDEGDENGNGSDDILVQVLEVLNNGGSLRRNDVSDIVPGLRIGFYAKDIVEIEIIEG